MSNFEIELVKKYIPKDKQQEAISKLNTGYPVQYIIGNVEFYGLEIKVNESALIPRFETEYLVEDLLKLIKEYNFENLRILDIGTGTGCISLALKNNLQSATIDAIEKNPKTLELAKENGINTNLEINWILQDITENFELSNTYDVIVSNPPYVKIGSSVDEKIKYEPQEAIYAIDDGLFFYKLILKKFKKNINSKNIIAFEIGDNQALAISKIAQDEFPLAKIISKKDLNGYDRYLYIINE